MAQAYLGIGANLGDRSAYIARAAMLLQEAGVCIVARSRLYESEPWGPAEQPRYINAAWAVQTQRGPHALLDALKAIESALGRRPTVRYGPRCIDLDILLYERLRLTTPRLTVPHPLMLERSFVLLPLADIAAEVIHPATGRTIGEHLARLGRLEGIAPYPPGLGG